MVNFKKAVVLCVASAAIIATAAPSVAQSIRAQRAQPAGSGPSSFEQQEIPNQERMACTSSFKVYYTQRGIAFTCRTGNSAARVMAIDHDKFPGGVDAAMTMLMTAKTNKDAKGFMVLSARYRSPTPKTKMICNLTGIVSTIPCVEVVALDI